MPLTLSLTFDKPETIDIESLEAEVLLTNTGSSPAKAPDPSERCELEFVFQRSGTAPAPLVLSAQSAVVQTTGDEPPEIAPVLVEVAPGQQLRYRQDVADFALEPLPPGDYQVKAVLHVGAESFESPQVRHVIVPPQLQAIATGVNPSEHSFLLALAHRLPDGRGALFQRKSADDLPDRGVAFCRQVLPAPGVDGVAHALGSPEQTVPWWYAWLQNGALGAELAESRTSLGVVKPVPVGLQSARLFPNGWQSKGHSALFAVLGLNSENKVALAVVRFDVTAGWSGTVKTLVLPIEKLPVDAQLSFHETGEQPALDFVWAEKSGSATRLRRLSITADITSVAPPTELGSFNEPLVALTISPLSQSEQGVADALFGPVGQPRSLIFVRIPLDGTGTVTRWDLADNPNPTNENARTSSWVTPSAPLSDPIVLAKSEGRLVIRRVASGSGWSPLEPAAAGVSQMQIAVLGDTPWALWLDPRKGFQFRRIP